MLYYDDEPDTDFDFLSPEKLEIIYRYLEDQQKLIDPSQIVSPSPSEASISPVSTPIAEPTSENGNFNDNLFKHNTDARALYNMFALPIALSNGSTDLLSMSQKSQGMELSDKTINKNTSRNDNCSEKSRNETKKKSSLVENYLICSSPKTPTYSVQPRTKDSSKYLGSNLKDFNLSKREAPCSFNHKDRSNSNLLSKKSKNKVHSPFSKKLSKHRITLPKLERINPTENAKRWLNTLQFSEKDFLGLEDKRRLVVINNMTSKNTRFTSSSQTASLLQTESQSHFFPRVHEPETSDNNQPSSFRKHALPLRQKTDSSYTPFDFDLRELDFPNSETSKKKFIKYNNLFEEKISEPVEDDNLFKATDKPLLTSFFENLDIHSGSKQAPFLNSKIEGLFMHNNTIRSPNPYFPTGFSKIQEEESSDPRSPSLPIFSSPTPFTEFNIHETLELLQRPSGNLLGCSSIPFYPKKFSGT